MSKIGSMNISLLVTISSTNNSEKNSTARMFWVPDHQTVKSVLSRRDGGVSWQLTYSSFPVYIASHSAQVPGLPSGKDDPAFLQEFKKNRPTQAKQKGAELVSMYISSSC